MLPMKDSVKDNYSTERHLEITLSKESSSDSVQLEQSTSLRELARDYDVRSMSPQEMSIMSQKLFNSDHISFREHALLSFQPELGVGFRGNRNLATEKKDFILHWENQLELHEKNGEKAFAENDKKILNILNNLQAIHDQNEMAQTKSDGY